MAALVQSYPQQSGTVTMLQTRSTSSQAQSGQQYGGLPQQRNGYHAVPGAPLVYRGSSTPIQPYAFTSTPSLNSSAQWQQFSAYRTSSTPAVPTMQSFDGNNAGGRSRYPASASMNNLPIIQSSASLATSGSRDDSSLPPMGRRVAPAPRPQSSYMASPSTQLSFPPPQAAPARPSPERYRRPQPRSAEAPAMGQQGHHQMSAMPSGSGMATVNHLYNTPRKLSPSLPSRPNSYYGNVPGSAVDDISLHRQQSQEAKRVRRRSMPALDSADYPNPLTPPDLRQPEESSRLGQLTPPETTDKEQIKTARIVSISAAGANAMHARNGSSESLVSSRSSHSRPSSSANRNTTNVSTPTGNPAQFSTLADQNSSSPDYPKLVNIPPRSSSSDAAKRIANPSPLSKPVTMEGESETAGSVAANGAATPTQAPPAASSSHHTESPAVKQLAAISQKGGKLRSKTSRLRRAFSFGSAAELRNAGVTQDSGDASSQGPSKLHKEPTPEELYDAEQARIAEQQEAAGIGNSIYGAKLFSGSTDNLSISSTASSASIMIRKMGRGMKKGGRSLVGLFRPKSVIGVPPADAPVPEVSQATVSMITVEAERERVNVNADPHSQNGGGTGFPRLERNSIDASKAPSLGSERLGSSGTDSGARKSIVGGEKERAEVLAAVRKGILKNTSGSSSPSARPVDSRNPAFDLPAVPHVSDSPISSAPSTPTEEAQGHKRTGSVAIGSEDYFMTALRLRQDTKSAPTTPQGTLKRNATFSPRIVFYDTWPSQEYDRRGEIATCNRLTPMLAQQIKEELNTFKMEMEVHENSKIYTHFF